MNENLTAVFFDPFADMTNDQERKAVEEHISTLWNFAMTKNDFALKSIQDVLDDTYQCQKDKEELRSQKVIHIEKSYEIYFEI